MLMRRFSLLGFLFFVMAEGFAQQDPLYSQYINNPFVLNPAYAGLTNNLNLSLSYRNQWAGYEGSPKTLNANGHLSLVNNKMGLGLMIVSDRIGNHKTNEVMAAYSYRISLTPDKLLSFGLQAGITNFQLDNSKATPYDATDPLYQGKVNEIKPTIGFGVILKSDRFFASVSVPRMLKSAADIDAGQTSLYTQHYYAMGSYLFFLTERIRFKPAALLKMVSGAPLSIDVNASLIVYENYQVGLLTRNFNTHGIFLMALLKDTFRVGYVFEIPTASSVGTNFTTHEVTLGFRMKLFSFHNNSSVLSF
jgi:type IX secretion system PorP/SprF family membrane protein